MAVTHEQNSSNNLFNRVTVYCTWRNHNIYIKSHRTCSKIGRGFVAFSSISLSHSIKVIFDELLWKYLVCWKVKGCLLKMEKEPVLFGYCRKKYKFFLCVTNSGLLDVWTTLPCLTEPILVPNQSWNTRK